MANKKADAENKLKNENATEADEDSNENIIEKKAKKEKK